MAQPITTPMADRPSTARSTSIMAGAGMPAGIMTAISPMAAMASRMASATASPMAEAAAIMAEGGSLGARRRVATAVAGASAVTNKGMERDMMSGPQKKALWMASRRA